MSRMIVDGDSKFILNPTRAEMTRFLAGFDGAAFWAAHDGNVALGANPHCSIDHSTVAAAYALGDEKGRGYIALDLSGNSGTIEFWVYDTPSPTDETRISSVTEAILQDQILRRLVDRWRTLVFDVNTGETLSEHEITKTASLVMTAPLHKPALAPG